jgi:cation diffusion facilitator family transporter
VIGLVVNVVCALTRGQAHDHGHGHGHHHHGGDDHHHEMNLKTAYVHVIGDAATSVLAIAALAGGWLYGWAWLDPMMGIVGAVLVAVWAKNLTADTGTVLLDREMDAPVVEEICEVVEASDHRAKLVDLHVWRVGQHAYSCALSVVTKNRELTANHLRDQIGIHEEIVHSTIEVHYLP